MPTRHSIPPDLGPIPSIGSNPTELVTCGVVLAESVAQYSSTFVLGLSISSMWTPFSSTPTSLRRPANSYARPGSP